MGKHGRPRKEINGEFPQVADFSQYLRDLIDARDITKAELLEAAKVKGHGRLDCYLNGEAVPEPRVLEVYFSAPLASFAPLSDTEAQELQVRYEAACQEREPQPAKWADRVAILEYDLTRMRALAILLAKTSEHNRRTAEELGHVLRTIECDLVIAKQQVSEAENAERQSQAQTRMLSFQATWYTHNLTARAMQITTLQDALRGVEAELQEALATISQHEETIRELEDNRALYDRLSVHHRREIATLKQARQQDQDQWSKERGQLAEQVRKLKAELDSLRNEKPQATEVSPIQANAAGPVEEGRPGWHMDGTTPNLQAYYDGQQWTGEKRPAPPMVRAAIRPKGRHAKPEIDEVERRAEAAWQGYCVGYTAVERSAPGWAVSVMANKPVLPELPARLLQRPPVPVYSPEDPARQAFEAGFWHAINNRCISEGAIQEAFRNSERVTGGGRHVRPAHVSPTAITVPDTSYALDGIIPTPVTDHGSDQTP
ncbi:hypothetical protein [Actinomadura nitritigenes]|uniref:hypothetical protein n=1 Tax=Actinomadura nitritigenes TaxID=134602 RepID=UPI003D8C5318